MIAEIGYNKLQINELDIIVVDAISTNASYYNSFIIACDHIYFVKNGLKHRLNNYALINTLGYSLTKVLRMKERFKENLGADDIINICNTFKLNYRFFFEDNQPLCLYYKYLTDSIYRIV